MHGLHKHICSGNAAWNAAQRNDPTRTFTVRSRFERDLVRRMRALQKAIRTVVVEENGFNINARFSFPRSEQRVEAFMQWLNMQTKLGVLEVTRGFGTSTKNAWWNIYIQSAYQKGVQQSASRMKQGGIEVSDRWIESAFYRPIHADSAGLIFTRTYSGLKGITDAMQAKIAGSLAQSMVEGLSMTATASALTAAVEAIGVTRGRALARTEVIRSHADATLNSYSEAQIAGVMLDSEFATAGDGQVCPKCDALAGKVYTIQEAAGVIPVHPNCRCAWLPVVRNPEGIKLL